MKEKQDPWFVFDVDDVLCDCSEAVRNIYNEKFGTNLAPAAHYNTIAAFPDIGPKGARWFTNTYTNGQIMGSLPVLDGAQKMAEEIAKDFRVAYCTHRPEKIHKETIAWLNHYGFPDGEVNFNHGSKVSFRERTRGPIAFIDDNAEYLNQISVVTTEPTLLICVNMPHNLDVKLTDSAWRVSNNKMVPIIAKRWKESLFG